jgi:hypothetical protein
VALLVAPLVAFAACGPAPSARAAASPTDGTSAPSSMQVSDRDATIQRCVAAARACAAPILAGDFAAAIACMPDDVVAARGGRDALVAQAEKGAAQMKADGGEIVSFTIDNPSSLAASSTRIYAVVPTRIVVKVSGFEGERRAYDADAQVDDAVEQSAERPVSVLDRDRREALGACVKRGRGSVER